MIENENVLMGHFMNLNVSGVQEILPDQHIYLNKEKSLFIQLLWNCFGTFKKYGDSYLTILPGRCEHVNGIGTNTYCLYGNRSRSYIEILVMTDENNVTGIAECYCFSHDRPFKNLKERLYIDPDKGSPF